MRIEFERSGGVAGLRLSATIESDSLPNQEADDLCKLVEDAGFFDLPADITSPKAQPDQFVYAVTVETEARRHTVRVDDSTAPARLQPLLDWLSRAVRRSRRRGGQ